MNELINRRTLLFSALGTALGLSGLSAAPAGAVRLTRRRLRRNSKALELDIRYPQISGMRDRALQTRLNRTLASVFPPGGEAEWRKRALEGGDHLSLDASYEVGVNHSGLLSVYWGGMEFHSKNGQSNEAHPTKHFRGVTLDTRTGRAYTFRDLFKPNYWPELDRLIARSLAQGEDTKDIGSTEDDFRQQISHHQYRFFLDKTGITFFDIFQNFAAGGVQTTVPYSRFKALALPGGPLTRLIKR